MPLLPSATIHPAPGGPSTVTLTSGPDLAAVTSTCASRSADEKQKRELSLLWSRLTERDKECAQLRTELTSSNAEKDAEVAGLRGELHGIRSRISSHAARADHAERECAQLRKELSAALGFSPPMTPKTNGFSDISTQIRASTTSDIASDTACFNEVTCQGDVPQLEDSCLRVECTNVDTVNSIIGVDDSSLHQSVSSLQFMTEGTQDDLCNPCGSVMQMLRIACQEERAALDELAFATAADVELLCQELEACQTRANMEAARYEVNSNEMIELRRELEAKQDALECSKAELAQSVAEVLELQSAVVQYRVRPPESGHLIAAGCAREQSDRCRALEEEVARARLEVADAARRRTLLRKRSRNHRKRARLAVARLTASRRDVSNGVERLRDEQKEWMVWRDSLVEWWQEAVVAGAAYDLGGSEMASAPMPPVEWRYGGEAATPAPSADRQHSDEADAGSASNPVVAMPMYDSMRTASAPACFLRGDASQQDIAAAEESGAEPALGTSFLMNCSKDSRAQAKGRDVADQMRKWIKLPRRLKRFGKVSDPS